MRRQRQLKLHTKTGFYNVLKQGTRTNKSSYPKKTVYYGADTMSPWAYVAIVELPLIHPVKEWEIES